jgi:hypothetical protein
MPSGIRSPLPLVVAALVLGATSALAQSPMLRGTVVFADGRTPAPAILIEAVDALGSVAGRALTNARGEFSLSVSSSNAHTLRALRVGYRPTVVTDVVPSATPMRVVLQEIGTRIAIARITTEDVCGIQTDAGSLVATAWEEVRKAIASASAASSGDRFRAKVLTWNSTHALDGTGPIFQQFAPRELDTPEPYSGAAGRELARLGYARAAPGGAVDYLGPDAQTLISEQFAEMNCFRLTPPDADHPSWLGIAFRPARVGRAIVEIAGTFWIDTTTSALRILEYTYTNAPRDLSRIGAGGRIEFDRLSSGEWLVRRWSIRLATRAAIAELNRNGTRIADLVARLDVPPGAPTPLSRLFATISGGEVLAVRAEAREVLPVPATAWRAQFAVGDNPGSPPGASVELLRTGAFALADSSGLVVVSNVQPGRDTVIASTHALRSLAMPGLRTVITIAKGDSAAHPIRLPTDVQVLGQRCGTDTEARRQAVVFGIGETVDPEAADTSIYSITWLTDADRNAGGAARWVADSVALSKEALPRSSGVAFKVDEHGRWFVCGIPRGSSVRVTVLNRRAALATKYVRIGESERIVDAGVLPPRVP